MGDYTWRLACELVGRGHECHLLALADYHVEAPAFSTRPLHAGTDEGIPCLRLPATSPWSDRLARAKKYVEGAAPDWISWQFVLYGFDSRGFGIGLGKRLRYIAGDHRNQVMFHEVWLGESAGSTWKERTLGALQRRSVRDVLGKLNPSVVHTHTPLYQLLLEKVGAKAGRLPLFGNIPVTSYPRADWLAGKWPEGWNDFGIADRAAWWVFVIFGSIHPEWDAEDFWQRASAAAQRAGKKCAFISIGRPGAPGERILQDLRRHEGKEWRFLELGPQHEEEVSQCLFAADFGVSPVPPEILTKSGTTAAMIEHGLPVIATRKPATYVDIPPEKLLAGMSRIVRDFDLEGVEKTEPGSLLPEVAGQFVESLKPA